MRRNSIFVLIFSLFLRLHAIDESSTILSAAHTTDETCAADGICDIIEKPEEVPKGANVDGQPREAVADCIDRYPKECQDYASWGECEKNPGGVAV